jgi:tetrahydromethanopterin S-methyltransferase subunit C
VATGNFTDAWLYTAGPIIGAVFAAIVHATLGRLTRRPATERLNMSAAPVRTTA